MAALFSFEHRVETDVNTMEACSTGSFELLRLIPTPLNGLCQIAGPELKTEDERLSIKNANILLCVECV